MPAWLISLLVSIFLKVGLPALLDWLKKRFPWIPLPMVMDILSDHVKGEKDIKTSKKVLARRTKERLVTQLTNKRV